KGINISLGRASTCSSDSTKVGAIEDLWSQGRGRCLQLRRLLRRAAFARLPPVTRAVVRSTARHMAAAPDVLLQHWWCEIGKVFRTFFLGRGKDRSRWRRNLAAATYLRAADGGRTGAAADPAEPEEPADDEEEVWPDLDGGSELAELAGVEDEEDIEDELTVPRAPARRASARKRPAAAQIGAAAVGAAAASGSRSAARRPAPPRAGKEPRR
ncbi:unnamed protein product, partial [Prorocentrum cordatum]